MTHRDLKNFERELLKKGYSGESYFASKVSYVWRKVLATSEDGNVHASMRIQSWDHSETNDINPCAVLLSAIISVSEPYDIRIEISTRANLNIEELEQFALKEYHTIIQRKKDS